MIQARAALGEAIERARRAGELDLVDDVVDWPGFRRRLRHRFDAWTRVERPVDGPPPDDRPVTIEEWTIYRHYRALLDSLVAVDDEGFSLWASKTLRAKPPGSLRKLGAVTVLDLTVASRAMLRAIEFFRQKAKSVDVTVPYLDDPRLSDVYASTALARQRLREWGFVEQSVVNDHDLLTCSELHTVGLELFRSDAHGRPKRAQCPGLKVVGAPRGEGIGLVVARRVQDCLDQGVEPEAILVLVPEWDDRAVVIRDTLADWGILVAAEAPARLALDPAVSVLRLAMTLGIEGWDTARLMDLLRNGQIHPQWPEAQVPLALSAAASAVRASRVFRGSELLQQALLRDTQSDDTRRASRAREARKLIERVIDLIERLDQSRTWDYQCGELSRLADELGIAPERLDPLWDALADHGALHEELGQAGRYWTWGQFAREVTALVGDLVVPAPAAPGGTVLLMVVDDAEGASAEHVLLVNLAEGTFPSASAVNPELIDSEADPTPSANPALAREMFRFLQVFGRAQSGLDLVYPTTDEKGESLLRAGFLEDLLDLFAPSARALLDQPIRRIDPAHRERPELAGAPRDATVRALALACEGDHRPLRTLAADPGRRAALDGTAIALDVAHERFRVRAFGPYDGRLDDPLAIAAIARSFGPEYVFSPSQFESFIACPFQFLQRYVLRLEVFDEREELDEDYTARGSKAHDILEELEQRLLQEPSDRLELARALVANHLRVELTVESEIDAGLREIEKFRLEQMFVRYTKQHDRYVQSETLGLPLPHRFEAVFGDERKSHSYPSLVIGDGAESVRLQGKIDRIDLVETAGQVGFRVIDYKTGSCPSKNDVEASLYVQLPLYALAAERILLLERKAQLIDVGYWGLKKDGFKRIVLKHWDSDQSSFEAYIIALARLIRSGAFPVHSLRDDCTKFCEFSSVCRIRQVRAVGKERDGFPTHEWLGEREKAVREEE